MNLLDLTNELVHGRRYDALVSARPRRAAVEIAEEALPEGARAVYVEAEDVALHEGRDSWHVSIWFADRKGRAAR